MVTAHDAPNNTCALDHVKDYLVMRHSATETERWKRTARDAESYVKNAKKNESDREKYLQNLMMNSKRKTCTCKTPFAHSEKCPMHMRKAGERPYPGCDVMSREDSDWLQQQQRKRKAKAVDRG